MKVQIKNNQKANTISNDDIHSNGNSLRYMIESANKNVRRNIYIDKIDDFSKTFTMSYAKSHEKILP